MSFFFVGFGGEGLGCDLIWIFFCATCGSGLEMALGLGLTRFVITVERTWCCSRAGNLPVGMSKTRS